MLFSDQEIHCFPLARRHAAEQRAFARNLLSRLLAEPLTEANHAAWRAAAHASILSHVVSTDMPARRHITKVDVPDAYTTGKRTRLRKPKYYTTLPSPLDKIDEPDRHLCLECNTPIWGEAASGDEWQM